MLYEGLDLLEKMLSEIAMDKEAGPSLTFAAGFVVGFIGTQMETLENSTQHQRVVDAERDRMMDAIIKGREERDSGPDVHVP